MLTPEKEGLKFGDAKPIGAREILHLGEKARWEGGDPCKQRARAGGLGSRLGQTRPGAPTSCPRPAAAGGSRGPKDSKVAVPRPTSISADSTEGCPEFPHLERGGTGGSGRRNRPQRSGRRPEVKSRDRNRLKNRKLSFETETRWRLDSCSPCFFWGL